jgi:diguanylate cyclase (GGDEF)-like protein
VPLEPKHLRYAPRVHREKTGKRKRKVISLKKYLDLDDRTSTSEPALADPLLAAAMECYRGALLSVGRNAVLGSPSLGLELEKGLQGLERRLAFNPTAESVKWAQTQVEIQLQEWGARTADHLKAKSDEVKEVLIALARTAESVGNRNQSYSGQFKDLTARLEKIGNLDDITEIRSSLVQRVTELKTSVDQMTRDSQDLVAHLQAEVSTFQTRLKAVESLILKDELTGVANRRSLEERISWNIRNSHTFCVVMLDLNGFKQVNDKHGHQAGDDLLKQFATELQMNTRSGDLVGRWGGDEFVVLLLCNAAGAAFHVGRIREWVFGKYTVTTGANRRTVELHMDASIGMAEWHSGTTIEQLLADADAAMYRDKKEQAKALHALPAR